MKKYQIKFHRQNDGKMEADLNKTSPFIELRTELKPLSRSAVLAIFNDG